ncbi:indole-3-glycerol phosphate synthase TrpC [Rossellomorea marisflavi]|uniref:Indole-3-glycerol phosphate synthase n=1 Tax=Rossellomorea marisflavi TaxID=189381 RepID=A0A165J6K9_9BACI|nr:indole-3-glycerol phosphate synthase TrpC [Rossellomorea marisflavi]KMK97429.1 indole-3-glycerol phosphate synthase [Rossellomorea marisflavi]KZE45468.1 indole-3-glycerol phosphate synthase [Rossellomorea marisflavi]QHA36592.1 indole-3-glycerol phosphate synthase TrpC [Rossellomorea marisflavi]
MTTILETIIEKKKEEVAKLKTEGFRRYHLGANKKPFHSSLQEAHLHIIAEIKRASPSKGDIRTDVDPLEQAKSYERAGAAAISVLTDQSFFKGTFDDLAAVSREVSIPVLCKDFMIDECQIDQAEDAGASIILLIAAALDDRRMKDLYDYARGKDLEVLVEVHDEVEMQRALALGASVIGINNRNLKTFEVDIHKTGTLSALVDGRDVKLISESGIKAIEDCKTVAEAGADAVLIGETLMRSKDPAGLVASFQVKKVSG